MQKYSKLLIVLPCHSLEDFPTHHRGSDAADLLANWTALWHPALISSCQCKPEWHQADNPDPGFDESERDHCLAVIPVVAESTIDSELRTNLEKENALIISEQGSRAQIVRLAIDGNEFATSLEAKLDPEIASDFMALGYAFLQIQIMTRQLRYSSNLDEAYFSRAVVDAANFATSGDHEKAREGLTRCFDLLLEEKNGYYPVEPELIDLVLTAPATLGESLSRQLDQVHPLNVLLTGVVTDKLFAQQTQTAARLKQQVEDGQITLVGGLADELPDTLLSTESSINQLRLGRENFRHHFGVEPTVFMRRRFGLNPALPGLLDQLNFVGAIHATLDDGKFPPSSSCNIRWTGEDDRSILAIGELPLAADDAGSFLGLGVRLGEAIDSAHIAAAVFVHWPDSTCESFQDLMRVANYSPLLGSFVGLNDYFDSIYDPGYGDTFTSDEYKAPFLKQAVERQTPNPVSSVTRYWERFYQLNACRSLLIQVCAKTGLDANRALEFQNRIDELQTATETELNVESSDDPGTDQRIEDLTNDLKIAWNPASPQMTAPSGSSAVELINPTSFGRPMEFETAAQKTGTLKHDPPVVICDSASSESHWVLEVPSMGTVEIDLQTPGPKDLLKSDPSVGEGLLLRNEFFELQVDETTGGIRGIQIYNERGNLASQQLAMRIPAQRDARDQPMTRARYTSMVADEIESHAESRLAASIVSRGRLLDGERSVADYEQSVRVVRGKRVIEIELEVHPGEPLTHSINHYICSRLAWKSEASRIIANSQETRNEVNSDWFLATNFIEIVQDQNRVTLLTGGLPYHRRASRRITDSLLVVGAEQRRRFKFGLGINVPYAMTAAVSRLTPLIEMNPAVAGEGKNSRRWLFHFDCKNILATWWQPFFDEQSRWAGVQIRLRETEGRTGKLGIRCPREIASGEQVNLGGDFLQSLEVAKDDSTKLEVEFGRFDYFQVSIHWKL